MSDPRVLEWSGQRIKALELELEQANEELKAWRKRGKDFDLYRVEVCNSCRNPTNSRECHCKNARRNYRVEIHWIPRPTHSLSMGMGAL